MQIAVVPLITAEVDPVFTSKVIGALLLTILHGLAVPVTSISLVPPAKPETEKLPAPLEIFTLVAVKEPTPVTV